MGGSRGWGLMKKWKLQDLSIISFLNTKNKPTEIVIQGREYIEIIESQQTT